VKGRREESEGEKYNKNKKQNDDNSRREAHAVGTHVRSSRLLNMLAEADVTAPYSTNTVIKMKMGLQNKGRGGGQNNKKDCGGGGHSFKKRALEIGSAVSAV
jgi:hypothetical protein